MRWMLLVVMCREMLGDRVVSGAVLVILYVAMKRDLSIYRDTTKE